MKKIGLIVAAVSLSGLFAAPAFADSPPPAAGAKPAPAADKAPPADMNMKPAAELQAYKGMMGNWKCKGTAKFGGKDFALSGTNKFTWDLGNAWAVMHLDLGMHKGVTYYGYDSGAKTYTAVGMNGDGSWSHETSPGPDATGKWAWTGKMKGAMGEMDMTEGAEPGKSANEAHITGSIGAAGSWDMSCKK